MRPLPCLPHPLAHLPQEVADALPAVVDAVKRWAGPDQARGLMLGDWVFHRVAGLRAFLPPLPPPANGSGGGSGRAREVLAALAAAAAAIRAYEFCQLHGDWLAGQPVEAVEPEVLAFWREAQGTTQERYQAASQLAAELDGALHGALLDGYLFVLPTVPGPAPAAGDAAAVAAYRAGAAELGALAALSGAPQAVLPLPRAGALPLSVSLVGLHKRDLALLAAAAKLGPMLQQEAAKRAARAAGAGQQAAAGGGQRGARRTAAAPSPQAEAEVQAEACKTEGNASFKAGRFEDAARHYRWAGWEGCRCRRPGPSRTRRPRPLRHTTSPPSPPARPPNSPAPALPSRCTRAPPSTTPTVPWRT